LDGLRGIAAIFVANRHMIDFFDGFRFFSSYLAVDLFYLLSGFVICFAYEKRLKSRELSAGQFITIRLIRMLPFLWAAIAIMAFVDIVRGQPRWEVYPFAALFLPTSFDIKRLWLIGPAWTLTYEIAINIMYGVSSRVLTVAAVTVVCTISGLALIWAAFHYGRMDGGFRYSDIPLGVARIFFPFTAGMLICRARSLITVRLPGAAVVCMIVLIGVLVAHPPKNLRSLYEIFAVMVVFPAIIAFSINVYVPESVAKIFIFIGHASYPLYILHAPTSYLIRHTYCYLTGQTLAAPFAVGVVVLVLYVAMFGLIERHVESRLRNYLRRRLIR
jgi:peptidoglycan/LPS O-acetylase OafA/YrhL